MPKYRCTEKCHHLNRLYEPHLDPIVTFDDPAGESERKPPLNHKGEVVHFEEIAEGDLRVRENEVLDSEYAAELKKEEAVVKKKVTIDLLEKKSDVKSGDMKPNTESKSPAPGAKK
jgi:hypothetical protein